MSSLIEKFDRRLIARLRYWEVTIARASIFILYFWFGLLKLIGVSPATPLVRELFNKCLGFLSFGVFYPIFSLFEMLIGLLFLIKGMERLAILLLGVHVIMTILPLVFLPQLTWQAFLIPTMEGQYIIKNVLMVALAVAIGSRLIPLATKNGK